VTATRELSTHSLHDALPICPDLSAWSKSLANGYALAALLGADSLREAAGRIWATGSFWFAGAPMAAALTTLRIFNEIEGVELMRSEEHTSELQSRFDLVCRL